MHFCSSVIFHSKYRNQSPCICLHCPALLLPLPPPLRPNLLFPSPHPDSCSSNPFLGKLFHQTGAWFILSPLSNICTLLPSQLCPALALRFKIANHHKDTLYPLLCCSFLCSPCHPLVCCLVILYFFMYHHFLKYKSCMGGNFFSNYISRAWNST